MTITRNKKTEMVGFRTSKPMKKAIQQAAVSLEKSMADFCHDTLWDKLELMDMLPEGR